MTVDETNKQIGEEYERIMATFPGLSQATALDIACKTVALRNRPEAEKRKDAIRMSQEREEVMRDGRHPIWPR